LVSDGTPAPRWGAIQIPPETKKEMNKMKCKCVWHWKSKGDPFELEEEYSKVREKVRKAMKEHPDEFPEMGPSIYTGRGVGFRLVEGTYEQLMNLVAIWGPVEEWKLEVYFDYLSKAYERWLSYE